MLGAKRGGQCECGHAAGKHDHRGFCTVPDCEDCEGASNISRNRRPIAVIG